MEEKSGSRNHFAEQQGLSVESIDATRIMPCGQSSMIIETAKMTVVHLSTNDILGGAARAAYRLHLGLRRQDFDSSMFVANTSPSSA